METRPLFIRRLRADRPGDNPTYLPVTKKQSIASRLKNPSAGLPDTRTMLRTGTAEGTYRSQGPSGGSHSRPPITAISNNGIQNLTFAIPPRPKAKGAKQQTGAAYSSSIPA